MKSYLQTSLRIFGTLFVFSLLMTACSSSYQMSAYDDDDVYYAQKSDQIEMQTIEKTEGYENYGAPENKTNITEEKRIKDMHRREINRTILSSIAYAMLEGLYVFMIWCD